MNTVVNASYNDEEVLEINGRRFPVLKRTTGYTKNLAPLQIRFIQAAYDWNMSNRVTIEAKGLNQLIRKIESSRYRIVRSL